MVGHQPMELFADVLADAIDRSDAAAGAVSVWHCINFQQRIGFSEPITGIKRRGQTRCVTFTRRSASSALQPQA